MEKFLIAGLALCLSSSIASGQELGSGEFQFSGQVTAYCGIGIVNGSGTMTDSGGVLDSSAIGGSPARLLVSSNANVTLTASAELTSSPPGLLTESLVVTGGIDNSTTESIELTSPGTQSEHDVHMSIASDEILLAGDYEGTVTVTCTETLFGAGG